MCIVLPFLPQIVGTSLQIEPNMARLTAEFHIAFNVALAVIFLLLLDPLAWLLVRLLPDRKAAVDPAAPRYLDESALSGWIWLRTEIPLWAPALQHHNLSRWAMM